MSSANVQKIEALEDFQRVLQVYAERLVQDAEDATSSVRRIERIIVEDYPAYWAGQLQIAEADRNEALDNLQRARSAVRAVDRAPATEAAARVKKCERRVRLCEQKLRRAKEWKIRIQAAVNDWLGPRGDLVTHGESILPQAVNHLKQIIQQLKDYQQS